MSDQNPQNRETKKLRIANVGFLNSAPYQAVSVLDSVLYEECSPTECARRLHEEECDLACIPIAEYFYHGGYLALPFGIASQGAVKSVCLVAQRPLSELTTIFIDNATQTSVVLLKLLIARIYPGRVNEINFRRLEREEALNQVKNLSGALVIGDLAVGRQSSFAFNYDLGELWYNETQLPFLYALWAGRPEKLTAKAVSEITDSFRGGIRNREVFAREWAENHNFDRQEAASYVRDTIRYEISPLELKGAEEFLSWGQRANIFPDTSLRLFGGPPAKSKLNGTLKSSALGNASPTEGSRVGPLKAAPKSLDSLLQDSSVGRRISNTEALTLANDASLGDLALAADLRRETIHTNRSVSYIIDRNINYTNVCNVYCRFCAFYRAPGKGDGYLLTKEEIGKKIEETINAGGIQILLQGGLNPILGIEYYEDLFRWIKSKYQVNLHALSSDEIIHISKVSNLTIEQVFGRLIAAGLGSFPGGGAEILVDRVRKRIARLKTSVHDWLECHRTAHYLGLTSTCTMMFGVQETWTDRILHLQKLRTLQDETGGFTAFIAWPFQDENTKLKRGDTSAPEYLRVQAVSRLFLDNILNVQSSWVTMGPSLGQVALFFGANDFGSVMFEENVVSAAGTTYCMNSALIERHIREAGFKPWRRDVHYNHVS